MSNYLKCDCCNSTNILQRPNLNNYYHFVCQNCSYELFTPTINDINIDSDLYENDSDYINDSLISKNYKSLIMWSHQKAYKFIKKDKNITSILDFGTYNGFFVKFLRDRNINAYGYDFNKNCIEVGRKNYNLKEYITSNIRDIDVEKYDCITAFEVIEHLNNINDFIITIKNLLNENGVVILSTPNNKMLWRPPLDSPPHHLSRFTSKSLSKLLEANNFTIIKAYEQMSIFDLLRNYFGVMFRNKNSSSLRGGDFKNLRISNRLKTLLNSSKKIFYIGFYFFDLVLYFFGFRYISQVIIAEKNKE